MAITVSNRGAITERPMAAVITTALSYRSRAVTGIALTGGRKASIIGLPLAWNAGGIGVVRRRTIRVLCRARRRRCGSRPISPSCRSFHSADAPRAFSAANDRVFWLQRWEGLLKQIKETAPRKKSEDTDKQQRVASL